MKARRCSLLAVLALISALVLVPVQISRAEDNDNNAEPQNILPFESDQYSCDDNVYAYQPSDIVNNILTINLSAHQGEYTCLKVVPPDYETISLAQRNAIEEVRFTEPGNITLLLVNQTDYSFHVPFLKQGCSDVDCDNFYDSTSLQSVTFPEGLTTLFIGEDAFAQRANLSNSLEKIVFPETLTYLDISSSSFAQHISSSTDKNAISLKTVIFPDNLEKLDIGVHAFWQTVPNGGYTSLETVGFPGKLNNLGIGEEAFAQSSLSVESDIHQALHNFYFNFNAQTRPAEIDLGEGITTISPILYHEPISHSAITATGYNGEVSVDSNYNMYWKWYGPTLSPSEMVTAWNLTVIGKDSDCPGYVSEPITCELPLPYGYTIVHQDSLEDGMSGDDAITPPPTLDEIKNAEANASEGDGLAVTGVDVAYLTFIGALLALGACFTRKLL